MKKTLLLAAALTIPAAVTADAAPRKAAANTQPAAETTGVATPDAPSAQTPARRQVRAAVGRSAAGLGTDAAVAGAQSAQSTIQVGNQCFRPTDSGRGYGYWTSCDQVYSYVLSRGLPMQSNDLLGQIERGADGGSGGGQ
jgi:hypothetical protein